MMKTSSSLTVVYFLLLLPVGIVAQNTDSSSFKEKYNIDKAAEDKIGYAQAVRVGNTIYVSGSVGWGRMEDALKLAYDRISTTLAAYNADFENVVKENLYTTALDSTIKYKDIRLSYYGGDFPAATWVEVQRLYSPSLVVEIEVVAVIPEKTEEK
jgi:2-iminobutanoate/2-iminopropanoate deaminase